MYETSEMDLERQAYHEAGHVVMASKFGRKIKSVWIGGCWPAAAAGMVSFYSESVTDTARLYGTLGGALAEKIRFGGMTLKGIGGDLDKIETLAARCSPQFAWESTLARLEANWHLVDAVAKRLIQKQWLPGRSVEKIVREAVKAPQENEEVK